MFSILNFEINFSEKQKTFSITWSPVFLFCQKPVLRQMEWGAQNSPVTKNGVLPVTTLFFWKFYICLKTSYKELIWCTNCPNVHINTFCKQWSSIWGCFFPEGILNDLQLWVRRRMPNDDFFQRLFLSTFQNRSRNIFSTMSGTYLRRHQTTLETWSRLTPLNLGSTTILLVCFLALKESRSEREHLWNYLFHLKSSFYSWENQSLEF